MAEFVGGPTVTEAGSLAQGLERSFLGEVLVSPELLVGLLEDVGGAGPVGVVVVADGAVRVEVIAARDAAVAAVLDYVQRHATTRYRIDGEVMCVDADGITVALFRQHGSRELDPQLHTHAVMSAKVPSEADARWLAFDARALMKD